MKYINSLILACSLSLLSATANATPIISFFIDGNTFYNSFEIQNDSTANEKIESASIDLSGLGVVFDTVSGGVVNNSDGKQFTPVGGSDLATGLVGPVVVADGASFFEMFFTDFDSGESIVWDIDLDFMPSPTRVDGDDLIGALVSIVFSSGETLFGSLEAVSGNSDASQFVASGITIGGPGSSVAVSAPGTFGILVLSMALMLVRRFR
ncbi:hypothetical protein [Alteromonas sp. BMJM2]|uniref:hypothetical protein n=1 Tax=Alteromonas sp. BMJM2 TaxID=2954241 RepID=UPI0022B2CEBA|nr:hypothetical protein [Alteromonas sp. BMJM2]